MNTIKISIIIEWDNPRLSESMRGLQMFKRLAQEVRGVENLINGWETSSNQGHRISVTKTTYQDAVEVILIYNKLAINEIQIKELVERVKTDALWNIPIHSIPTSGLGYYQLKNAGVKQSNGDIIVFVDSDVIPEEGWLNHLVESFGDSQIQIVAGNSYIDPQNLYSKTFGLTWFFPLRAQDGPMTVDNGFFANNVAFRRLVCEKYPFPEETERFRGQCCTLATMLQQNNIPIHYNPCVRVAHPAPNGLQHFVRRALCEGHDTWLAAKWSGDPSHYSVRASLQRLRSNLQESAKKIVNNYHLVHLSPIAIPLALVIASGYYSLCCIGEMMTRVDPELVRKRFAI